MVRKSRLSIIIMFDADSGAIYCLPVASKAVTDCVVYCVKSVIDELGYSEVRIALKNGSAPELQQIREQIRNLRIAPTTPTDVPVKESNMNGAVEQPVRCWEGQFRTVRDHLEGEIAAVDERQIDAKHPLWQWCAWWASPILKWAYNVRAHRWPPIQASCCEFRTPRAVEIASQEAGRRQTR